MAKAAIASETGGDTRETILRAALGTFAERGFDGASTREIAVRTGVNHGLIPYYFGAKEKLWRASVDLAFGEMQIGLEALLADASIRNDRERAALMIRSHVKSVARYPEFVRLMHDEAKRKGPRMRYIVDWHVKPLYEAITPLLVRGRGRHSRVLDIPPVHLFYILAGAAGVIFHQAEECRRVAGVDPFEAQAIENHSRALEQLLLGPPERMDGGMHE